MNMTRDMLDASPASLSVGAEELAVAIDACLACVQSCTGCADADLAEADVATLRDCIALNHICADICDVTARVLSRAAHWHWRVTGVLIETCVAACTACADECARHAEHHRHCAICARVCRDCIEACQALLAQAP